MKAQKSEFELKFESGSPWAYFGPKAFFTFQFWGWNEGT
jgi:hypothetical protein